MALHDVRMPQAGRRDDLAAKTLDQKWMIKKILTEKLQNDRPALQQVIRQIDVPHPAATEERSHPIARILGERSRGPFDSGLFVWHEWLRGVGTIRKRARVFVLDGRILIERLTGRRANLARGSHEAMKIITQHPNYRIFGNLLHCVQADCADGQVLFEPRHLRIPESTCGKECEDRRIWMAGR